MLQCICVRVHVAYGGGMKVHYMHLFMAQDESVHCF